MLIAHVKFTVSTENLALTIDTLKQEVEVVCAMKGCIAFIPFIDPTSTQCVGVLHEWHSADDFAAYIASNSFATIGRILRPIMVSPPVSKRFDATLIESVN
jgi:quinol monooxygenase YgiN